MHLQTVCLTFCSLWLSLLGVACGERGLQQAYGEGELSAKKPLSATPQDLVNDPSGRAHLLAALGNPPEYFANYPYPWPEGQYDIDPKIDPNIVTPIPGNDSPGNGSYKVVGNSGMISVHAIPFPNGEILFYGRPAEPYGGGDPGGPGIHYLTVDNGTWTEIASIYDTVTNTYEPFHIPEAPFCGAQTILPDGRAILVGGEHVNLWYPYLQYGGVAVRIYDPSTHTIQTVNNLDRARWYPSVMTMPDGNILIVGGAQQEEGGWSVSDAATSVTGDFGTTMLSGMCVPNGGGGPGDAYWDNPSFTIYNVSDNSLSPSLTLTILLEAWPINLYPYLFLMPTGSTLIVTGIQLGAMYLTADGATQDEAIGALPTLPYPVGPNQYTPITMLTLEPPKYDVQILVAGGTADFCPNTKSPANNQSYLIDVSPGADHELVTEDLAFPRLMGDLTLLPDGRVFLCNGAQVGLGGGGGPRYSNMNKPTTVAEIYDPSQPVGDRWSTVGDTQIPRLYHSVALLTANAEVLISGSETTSERRVQIWTPDYLLTGKPRPVITGTSATSIGYNGTLGIGYSNVSSVDRVVLMRPAPATHGVHFDSRSILLNCSAAGSSNVSCTAPPTANIAPPGQYMLFILADGVPSVATYVSLPIPESSEPAPPLSSINYTLPGGLVGGITGPASAPLYAEAPQGPAILGDPTGTNGIDPPGFDVASPASSNASSGGSVGRRF